MVTLKAGRRGGARSSVPLLLLPARESESTLMVCFGCLQIFINNSDLRKKKYILLCDNPLKEHCEVLHATLYFLFFSCHQDGTFQGFARQSCVR